jgi:hypothetical protein
MVGKAFHSDAIVIDPALPRTAGQALESKFSVSRLAAGLDAARHGRLIPFGQPAPLAPHPPRIMSGAARKARGSAIWTVLFLGAALSAAAAGSLPFAVVFLLLTAVTTIACVWGVFDARSSGWTRLLTESAGRTAEAARARDPGNWYLRHAAAYYHRRYVMPHTDFDEESKRVWTRAIVAANEIRGSEVVTQQVIDSTQVALALPQRLWEIAEGLARLSEVRKRQQESLRQAEPNDPHIAVKVTRQSHRLTLAAEHIDRRVGKLEEVARLLAKADALKRREAALGRLDEVDDLLLELLANTQDVAGDLDLTERLRLEAQAVIEQANEAAQSLALSDGGEKDT